MCMGMRIGRGSTEDLHLHENETWSWTQRERCTNLADLHGVVCVYSGCLHVNEG